MGPLLSLSLLRGLNNPLKADFPLKEKPTLRSIALSRRFRVICASVITFILLYHTITSRSIYTEPEVIVLQEESPAVSPSGTDWSRFAYVQYVTNTAYLCNAVMIFESLHRLGSKADRLMLVPETFNDGKRWKKQSKLMEKARKEYGVRVEMIKIQSKGKDQTWADSFTKLLAFNQTQYTRVLSLDSDSTVLQSMDELFLLPSTPIAMPKAYWLTKGEFSSQVILIEPSAADFSNIQKAIKTAKEGEYDMEILNKLYGKTATVLPHRQYDMITGEMRSTNHTNFLGNSEEVWDLEKVLHDTKFVHFSDWPIPKPWYNTGNEMMLKMQPICVEMEGGRSDCRARDKWLWFYDDFRQRRKRICEIDYREIHINV